MKSTNDVHPLLRSFLQPHVTSSLLGPNILQAPSSQTPSLCVIPNVRDKFSHPYKTRSKLLLCMFLDITRKTKNSELHGRKHFPGLVCS
jgi:hypothetical protein